MRRLGALLLLLFVFSWCQASVRDLMLRKISDYCQYPVRITGMQSSYRGFDENKDYELVSFRVQRSSGRAWFLLKDGLRTFWVQASFLFKVPVVVARRDIERGMEISASDVEPKYLWMKPSRVRGILAYSDVLGKVATRPIPPGTVITSSMVKRPVMVRRGQLVKFLLIAGGVRIEGVAKAMQSGCAGDWVKLRNLASGRVFGGEVIGEGRVLVR